MNGWKLSPSPIESERPSSTVTAPASSEVHASARRRDLTFDLLVAGVFEFRCGRTAAHRDYLEYQTWLRA